MIRAGQIAADWRSLNALVNKFREDESGVTAIEYGLIAALIVIAIIASLNAFSTSTSVMYNKITSAMTG